MPGWDEILKGTSGDDIITGSDGDDYLQGRAGGDVLDGGAGNDQIHGDDGDDHLRGGAGDDFINGGLGIDTAYYSGSVSEYTFTVGSNGNSYISHSGGTMIDGNDWLQHVERLVFADAVIDLTQNNAPIAFDDAASTDEDVGTFSSGSASVLDNDFDWEGDAMSVTAGSFTGIYGTLVLNADGTYTYTPYASTQSLAQGQSVADSFSYTVSDGSLTDTGTLTITIAGVNDAPVAVADAASTAENDVVAIDVLANDTDVDNGAVLTIVSATGPAGKGSVSIVGNQVQFDPGTDFDHLAVGASEVVVINYTIQDEHGASSSSTVEVTVTGTNDGPVANADAASGHENEVLIVDALANDTDVDDGAVLTIVAASAPSGKGTAGVVGNQVQFDPGTDFDHLAVGASEVVVLNYTIEDQHGASASSTISVTVTGTNDGPVAVADAATTSENSAVLVDVLANDTDADDGAVLTVVAASAPAGQGSAAIVGNQVEFDPGSDFDYLAAGERVDVLIDYSIEDEHGAPSSSTVTVTVTGTNDAPTIDAGNTTATGSVTELPNNDPDENTFVHTESGSIAFDDVDLSDTHSASFTPQGGSYLGTFTLDPVDQSGDNVGWDFSVSDADLDSLEEGEVVTQTYTIEIDDGHGGTTTQDVTVTITGAADSVAPDGTNWYIDNSAVDSANTGSPTDPFTSIAAFNAAQGTPGGPGVGDNVFLLAGTGTGVYAEADGINLLDGQVLTGVATGAVRPTIEASGGDGVNLGQNNTVSGLDIVTVTGAGIADSNGTVGTTVVSDVGILGAGQIVDIDQGGILDVTLNGAASAGSAGGAIDLDLVSGSFTVTGATTIAGVHSGGGVDVTGSSINVSLAGGGIVSTGDATAINFAGNTGALMLGGGLDIVTTSGAGLNATAGGTVTFTGAGNSVTSTTGTAVTISGTTIGAAGVTLESVSSDGAASGIILANTGSLGGLTVTGTGVAGSGGLIQNSTGAAIVATDTQDLSLSSINLLNAAGGGILATDLRGDNALANGLVSGFGVGGLSTTDGIRIVNTDTNMGSFTVTGSTFSNGASGDDAIVMETLGTSIMVLKVNSSTFTGLFGDGVQAGATTTATGTVEVTVANSQFVDAAVNGNGGVSLHSLGDVTMRALVEGNTFDNVMRPSTTLGAVTTSNGGTATAHFTIRDNLIEDLPGGRGITFNANGDSETYLSIDGNSIDRLGSTSKLAISATFTQNAVGDLIISDNLIGQNGNLWTAGNGNANAIGVTTQNAAQLDLLIDGNLVTANSNFEVVRVRSINDATMNATVSNNTIRDTAGSDLEFDASAGTSIGTAVLNLNIFANLFSESDADVIRLNDAAGGVLNVTQSSAADVSTLNDSATVTVLGTVIFNQPPPPLPVIADLPMM